jgi:hypothetical protein
VTNFSRLSTILSTAIAVSFPGITWAVPIDSSFPAVSNSDSLACYMASESGKTLDLSSLCNSTDSSSNPSNSAYDPGSSGSSSNSNVSGSSGSSYADSSFNPSLTYVHGYTRSDGSAVGGYTARRR